MTNTEADRIEETNKYGVPKWLIEALKGYDAKMFDTPTHDKVNKMKAKRRLAAHINKELTKARKETAKAFGGCEKCYGKGYATVMSGLKGYEDFGGDGFVTPPTNKMKFCTCGRGKQLKAHLKREAGGTTMKTNHTGGDKLEKQLRELIWYELGGGLSAIDVNDAVTEIKKIIVEARLDELKNMLRNAYEHSITDLEMRSHQTNGQIDFVEAVETDHIQRRIKELSAAELPKKETQ